MEQLCDLWLGIYTRDQLFSYYEANDATLRADPGEMTSEEVLG